MRRFMASIGGVLFGFGVTGLTAGIVGWYYGGRYPNEPFFAVAIASAFVLIALRFATRDAPLRSGITAATIASVLFLVSCGLDSGMSDTKQAAYTTMLKTQLKLQSDFEDSVRAASGRYTIQAAPAMMSGITSRVTLTPSGWTAATALPR